MRIPGQLLVGHAHGGGDCPELHAQEFGRQLAPTSAGEISRPLRVRGFAACHFQPQRHAIGIGRTFPSGCLRGQAGDKTGEHGGSFLRTSFGVVVLVVEFVEL